MQVNVKYGHACQMWIRQIVCAMTTIKRLIGGIVRRQVVTFDQFGGDLAVRWSAPWSVSSVSGLRCDQRNNMSCALL